MDVNEASVETSPQELGSQFAVRVEGTDDFAVFPPAISATIVSNNSYVDLSSDTVYQSDIRVLHQIVLTVENRRW